MHPLRTHATIEPAEETSEELRAFAQVLCRALLMIIVYLNRRYRLGLKVYGEH